MSRKILDVTRTLSGLFFSMASLQRCFGLPVLGIDSHAPVLHVRPRRSVLQRLRRRGLLLSQRHPGDPRRQLHHRELPRTQASPSAAHVSGEQRWFERVPKNKCRKIIFFVLKKILIFISPNSSASHLVHVGVPERWQNRPRLPQEAEDKNCGELNSLTTPSTVSYDKTPLPLHKST